MKQFPRLYKKTSTGAIQFWDIKVENVSAFNKKDSSFVAPEISTRYGQLDTDSPQYTYDLIEEGKNIGKANETSPYEQAVLEAQSKWEKQKKKGYVESLESAQKDELDDLIEGGIVPMLAHSFAKHGHKIKYPCYVQPKLDGIRCIAIYQEGKCTLWSRTRKPITSCPHIVKEIESILSRYPLLGDEGFILDGELYNHEFKKNFEHIVHIVRQEEPDNQCTDVQYHIYDLVNLKPFSERSKDLFSLRINNNSEFLQFVPTAKVDSEEGVPDFFTKFKAEGYEGAMLRNADGLYVNKRSYDLLKVKEFEDAEFEITGISEGRGKLQGHVGAFVCRTKSGEEFLAKMSGETSRLKEYFDDHSLWSGRLLTVQYQGLTGKNSVPRFPVGLRIRESE